MLTSNPDEIYAHYLDALLASHGTLHLPTSSNEHTLPLESIFQPLILRHGPFSFEERQHGSSSHKNKLRRQAVTALNGNEALAKSRSDRMIVLGGPGMGKTTLLKRLLQQAIYAAQKDQTAPFPVFISLPDLARSGLTLQTYLPNVLTHTETDAGYRSRLVEAVREGRAFLCLDSLDEVAPAQRPDVIALINREAVRCGGTWIIGSRFTEYKGGQFAHSQFAEWELQPLDLSMRVELAEHLFPLLVQDTTTLPSAKDFVTALRRDPHIAAWGENPLLFSLAATVYAQAGMLPGSRAALYRDIVAMLLSVRTPDLHEQAELRQLLADVALHLYQTKGRNFSISELQALLTTHYSDQSTQMQFNRIAHILDSGLLDRVSQQSYGFKHQMFQEYLVAVALASKLTSQDHSIHTSAWQFLWDKHTYSRWREILRLCVGVLSQDHGEEGLEIAIRWFHRLADKRNTPDGDIGNLCLQLAVGSLRELATTLSHQFYTTDMVSAIRILVQRWAETQLQLRIQQNETHMYRADPDRLIEEVKELDLTFVLPAISWLEKAKKQGLQHREGYEIGNSVDEILRDLHVVVPALVLFTAYNNERGIILATCTQRETLQTYASSERLINLVQETYEDQSVRAGAILLLGEWRDPALIPFLFAILKNTSYDNKMRRAAAKALGKLQEKMPIEKLVMLLQDQDQAESIRSAVASALSNAGKSTPITALLAILHDTTQIELRNTLQQIFLYSENKQQLALAPLLDALRNRDEHVRSAAIHLLDTRTPREQLLQALNDPYAEVRIAAIQVVGRMQDPTLIPLLLRALQYQGMDVYDEALQSLKNLGAEIPVAPLIAFAKENNVPHRAFEIARELHVTLPEELLLATLDNQRYSPSDTAARLLANLGQQAPIQILLNMLCDPASQAQLGAAKALTLLVPHVPTEPVITLLAETDPSNMLYHYLVILLLRSGISLPSDTLVHALKAWSDGTYQKEDVLVTALSDIEGQAPINELLQMAPEAPDEVTVYTQTGETRILSILKNLYTWITPERLERALAHRVQDERLALKVLGEMGKYAPTDFIKRILDDKTCDYRVRIEARHALYKAGVLLPLHYFLAEKGVALDHTYVDTVTIATMRDLGSQAPIDELLNLIFSNYDWIEHPALLNDIDTFYENTFIYDTVIEALRALASYLPFQRLVEALDHSNPLARKGAARIIGVFGNQAPVDKLIGLLQNPDEKRAIRFAALRALVGDLQAYTPVEAITAVLEDEDEEFAGIALAELRKWEKGTIRIYSDHAHLLQDEATRKSGRPQHRAPVELFLSLQDDAFEQNRMNVIKALNLLGEHMQIGELTVRLSYKDGSIHTTRLKTFLKQGEYTPLDFIWQVFTTTNEQVRHLIEGHLDNLARAAPAQFVALAREHQSTPVRRALLQALAQLGKDAPIEPALQALNDEDTDIRIYAAIVLLTTDVDPASLPIQLLLQALQEKREMHLIHWLIRGSLAKRGVEITEIFGEQAELSTWACMVLALLTKCGERVPVEPLLAAVGDSNIFISQAAAKALYQTHPEAFGEVAQQAESILRGEASAGVFASRVQSRMADTVKHLERATPEVLTLLTTQLDWPYWEVRMKAAQALGAVHRNIPDQAVKRLLELRHDPTSGAIREAAEEALTQILAYEGGIEDE